ncbi:hypothetical protein [Microlunatus parietis]|uniref:YncE family protein n=1 Tax=Microlunatus parietis TaxID=682979 RepID=A0A7Y9I7Q2_9ACTN|nr:hypothetical protein [Microlunatus parietis]NYE71780.1 hypothetical protein [Microlunatus parietis]
MRRYGIRRRRPLPWIVGVLALTLAAGCGVVPGLPAGGPCPAGWQSAVLWSTEGGWYSQLAYVTGDGRIERQNLPYIGFSTASTAAVEQSGQDAIMAADGSPYFGPRHLITIDTGVCSVTGHGVEESSVWSIETRGQEVYTTNTLNWEGVIRRRDADRAVLAEIALAGVIPTKLLVHGDRLYALGASLEDDRTMMITLDADSLVELDRVVFPEHGSPYAGAIIDDRLYYPETTVNGSEGTHLRVIDLRTGRRSRVDLGSPAPYLMVESGEDLYIGHTFMNPGYRDRSEYRWVSRYDTRTGKVERFDVGGGLDMIAIKDQTLYVLSSPEDQETTTLRAFDLPGVTLRSEVVVPKPTGPGHYYTSAIILAGS